MHTQTRNVTAPFYQLTETGIRPFEGKLGSYDVSLTLTFNHSDAAEPTLVRKVGEAYVSDNPQLLKQLGPDLVTYFQEITQERARSLPIISTPRIQGNQPVYALRSPLQQTLLPALSVAVVSVATRTHPIGGLLMAAALHAPTAFGDPIITVSNKKDPAVINLDMPALLNSFHQWWKTFPEMAHSVEPLYNTDALSELIGLAYTKNTPGVLEYVNTVDSKQFNINAVYPNGFTLLGTVLFHITPDNLKDLHTILQHPDLVVYASDGAGLSPISIAISLELETAALVLIKKQAPPRYLAKALIPAAMDKMMYELASHLETIVDAPITIPAVGSVSLTVQNQIDAALYIRLHIGKPNFDPNHLYNGVPLLHYFISHPKDAPWAEALLECGADPNTHHDGKSALHLASAYSEPALRALLRQPDIRFEKVGGTWPYQDAIDSGNPAQLKLLRQRFGGLVEEPINDETTIVYFILSRLKEHKDNKQKTEALLTMLDLVSSWKAPLDLAGKGPSFESLCALGHHQQIKTWIAIWKSNTPQGLTIVTILQGLHTALTYRHLDISETILQAIGGVSALKKMGIQPISYSNILFQLAAKGTASLLNLAFQTMSRDEIAEVLNTFQYKNPTPLLFALDAQNVETATWLLEAGALVNPLEHFHIHNNPHPQLSLLLENQDRWAPETKGITMLAQWGPSIAMGAVALTISILWGVHHCLSLQLQRRRLGDIEAQRQLQNHIQEKRDQKIRDFKALLPTIIPRPFKLRLEDIAIQPDSNTLTITLPLPKIHDDIPLLPSDTMSLVRHIFDTICPNCTYEDPTATRHTALITIHFKELWALELPENAIPFPQEVFAASESRRSHLFLRTKNDFLRFSSELERTIRSLYIFEDLSETFMDSALKINKATHPHFLEALESYQKVLSAAVNRLQEKLTRLGDLQSVFNDVDVMTRDELPELTETKATCLQLITEIKEIQNLVKAQENEVERTLIPPKRQMPKPAKGPLARAVIQDAQSAAASTASSLVTINGAFRRARDKSQFLSESWTTLLSALTSRQSDADDSEAHERIEYGPIISLIGPIWFEEIKQLLVKNRSEFGPDIDTALLHIKSQSAHTQSFRLCANTDRSVRKRGGRMTNEEQITAQLLSALRAYPDFAREKGIPATSLALLNGITRPEFITFLTGFVTRIGIIEAPEGGSSHSRLRVPALVPGFGYSVESDILRSYFRLLALLFFLKEEHCL